MQVEGSWLLHAWPAPTVPFTILAVTGRLAFSLAGSSWKARLADIGML